MTGTDTQLKLIAIVLPEPLYSMIRDEQQFIAQKWGPKYALRTPPHITLIPPFSANESESMELENISQNIAQTNSPFILKVNGYEAFSPRVIFAQPNYPKPLRALYTSLLGQINSKMPTALHKYPHEHFVPHITLAYRDLDQEIFRDMWRYYKKKTFITSVPIDKFSILNNTPEGWEIGATFPLTGVAINNS